LALSGFHLDAPPLKPSSQPPPRVGGSIKRRYGPATGELITTKSCQQVTFVEWAAECLCPFGVRFMKVPRPPLPTKAPRAIVFACVAGCRLSKAGQTGYPGIKPKYYQIGKAIPATVRCCANERPY